MKNTKLIAAFAAVIMAVCLFAGCTAGVPAQEPQATEPQAAQPEVTEPEATEPEATEPAAALELTQEQLAALSMQCLYMSDFTDAESLDEAFFKDYIFLSYTSCVDLPSKEGGEEYPGYSWSVVSEADVRSMVKLYLGVDMPEYHFAFDAENPYIYWEDGSYYVSCSDFGDIEYVPAGTEAAEGGLKAYFDALSGGETMFRTCFELGAADNANGFVILSKKRM